jgi:hypothetical protein
MSAIVPAALPAEHGLRDAVAGAADYRRRPQVKIEVSA